MRFLLPSLLLALSALVGGCRRSPSDLPEVTMKLGGKTFELEVAKTEVAKETGLMNRDSMPASHGMIFVFNDEDVRAFWMQNTRIPLDIVFVNTGGKVVSIRQMKPYDTTLVSSNFPARYAIELNEGAAGSSGVKVGDQLNIPAEAVSK